MFACVGGIASGAGVSGLGPQVASQSTNTKTIKVIRFILFSSFKLLRIRRSLKWKVPRKSSDTIRIAQSTLRMSFA
jgi:hypothetical protein